MDGRRRAAGARRWRGRAGVPAALGVCGIVLLTARPALAQLTFPGAAPISSGNVIVRTQPEIIGYGGDVHTFLDKNVVIYGASPYLAFIVQNSTVVATTTPNGTAVGLGDTLLEARYTIYQQDGVGSTFRIAPYIGVSIPTGMDNANAALPRAAQPGTGVWGSRDALTMSYQTLYWNGGAEAGYQANGTADGYHFGNTFFADVGFHYLLWPRDLQGVVPAELYASLEANYSFTTANVAGGTKVPGTGAQLLLLDPGLIYTTPGYSVSLTGLLPAFERTRDNAARFAYGAILFVRLSFFTALHW